ncbi:MAG: hypothetical protein A3J01_00765 [Candidatus Yanofskybacteria bacterium RIFCSPLOWO2_02_FULL_45_18]|uniref:Homing endonuclease LAGLIDADG domain-containing protein n=1 Tax=Candidatus Yanofskybacteria bacterium RIFCSPLOWO2_02_FULL_45_18 TaxID=1802707 RepID=A0A1F8H4F5_9BACT|nr:MAG: hypothetical protein A3J01_00765 [Candidatus Yanofskybacteria bacterium RIFCSPLOWO2_02_FULL_45_18]
MPSVWSNGFTKDTHPSVRKMSETMRRKKIDNFSTWRERAKSLGITPSSYPKFKRDGNLAELMGVAYGDGNISVFPRTERLIIATNSNNKGFIKRYRGLVKKLFDKEPTAIKVYNSDCVRISIYQNKISKRLGIPSGNRSEIELILPLWIKNNHEILKRFLKV